MNTTLHNYYKMITTFCHFLVLKNSYHIFSSLTNTYTFYMNRHVLIHTDGTMHILPHCTVRLPGFSD